MTRSKLATKMVFLAGGIGLSIAALPRNPTPALPGPHTIRLTGIPHMTPMPMATTAITGICPMAVMAGTTTAGITTPGTTTATA